MLRKDFLGPPQLGEGGDATAEHSQTTVEQEMISLQFSPAPRPALARAAPYVQCTARSRKLLS